MPLLTEQKVLNIREIVYPNLDEEGVKRRMKIWGPTPRNVLVGVEHSIQHVLIAKLDSAKLAELTSVARRQFPWLSGGEGDTPHLAIHVRAFGQHATPGPLKANPQTDSFYSRGKCLVASTSILLYILQRIINEKSWGDAHIIESIISSGSLGLLRGLQFADAALKVLEAGGEFEIRNLRNAAETRSKVTLLPSESVTWANTPTLGSLKLLVA